MEMHTVNDNGFQDIHNLTNVLLNDTNVLFAFLFGSYARRRQKSRDLDIAIYFKKPPEGLELLQCINLLSDVAGREVDLVVLNNASAFLRHQVMKYGIPLVKKERGIYRRFREKVISDYDEYKSVSGMNVYDR